jgi:predicted phosphodiesterase
MSVFGLESTRSRSSENRLCGGLVRYAVLSDVHGRHEKLAAVLDDAHVRGVEQLISLGDVGGDDCLSLLREVGAQAVFGNYEVSGWQRLQPEHQAWVQQWRPLLMGDDFVAVHAAPWWPEGLQTLEDFGTWLKRTGRPWRDLFPYLKPAGPSWRDLFSHHTRDDETLWKALAELETVGKAILFHGHTHAQDIWCWEPAGRLTRVETTAVPILADHHYIVGVGSVGLPEDGGWAAYAIYDTAVGRIELIRLDRPAGDRRFWISQLPSGRWDPSAKGKPVLYADLRTDGRNIVVLQVVVPEAPPFVARTVPLAHPRQLIGTLGYNGVPVKSIADPRGDEQTLLSGSAPDFDPGGFALRMHAHGTYSVRFLE